MEPTISKDNGNALDMVPTLECSHELCEFTAVKAKSKAIYWVFSEYLLWPHTCVVCVCVAGGGGLVHAHADILYITVSTVHALRCCAGLGARVKGWFMIVYTVVPRG